ncbi:hypothetical protein [Streptomyces sp. NPDC058861]|uniref:hypothetical protein n=1 Tax=Streptomyces sp. NPDC058861 TaxID=3346653 RepID=UPI0036BEBAB8
MSFINDDQIVPAKLWFPRYWKDHSDIEWGLDECIDWVFRSAPREGEQISWQQAHRFQVVEVMHTARDDAEQVVHLHLDPATDADREHLRSLGGLCLRDRLILARASGTSWEDLGQEHEVLPATLRRYVQEQTALADDRDLVAEVVEGGQRGVDISGLDRAEVLAALWNNHGQSGEVLTVDEARAALAERAGRISALRGRPLQVVLTAERFNPWLYDERAYAADLYDRGHVTAEGAVAHLRATGSTTGAPRFLRVPPIGA